MVLTESLLHTSLFRHWQAKSWTFWMLIISHLFSSCPQSFACQDKKVGFSQRLKESKLSLSTACSPRSTWYVKNLYGGSAGFTFKNYIGLFYSQHVCVFLYRDQKQTHHQIFRPASHHTWLPTCELHTESSHKLDKDVRCKVSAEWLLTVSKLPLCMSSMGGRKRSASVLSFLSTVPPLRSSCSWRTRKRTFKER